MTYIFRNRHLLRFSVVAVFTEHVLIVIHANMMEHYQ